MKEFTFRYEGMHPGYPIGELTPEDRILFIDIETTGLSREHSDLYLIGCGFFDSEGYNTIQWFAQSPGEESLIIRKFTAFINGRFSLLVHYNGNHFDIPYLSYKAGKHGLENPLSGLDNYDIYAAVKPLKNIMGLYSLRQRCIEQLLDINSDDPYTGRELIRVYHDYVKTQDEKLLHPLIYHNSEDLKGMGLILPILHYTSLKDTPLSYVSHEIHGFSDLSGNIHSEILADYTHSLNIPKSIMIKHDDIVISLRSDKTAVIRIPLISETLKHYYDDYKNYYYLPAEDCCILKEIASGVDSSRIENAKKETCYTKHSGLFIPAITAHNTLFRSDLSSKRSYIPYSENDASKILSSIGSEILRQTF